MVLITLTIILICCILFPSVAQSKERSPIELTWYGHSTVSIYDGKTRLLIDPFFTDNPLAPCSWKELPPIDYILLTHNHADHIGDSLAIALHYNAKVAGLVEVIEDIQKQGLAESYIHNGIGFNVGGSTWLNDFHILMVPAIHTSSHGIAVGYFITSQEYRIYYAGDTAPYGDMKLWASWYPIDIALLPIGGYFTQDAFLATKATELIQPRCVLPIHYETFPLLTSSIEDFRRYLSESNIPTQLIAAQRGEVLYL